MARLSIYLDGEEQVVLAPPATIAPRSYLLGVVAVQLAVVDGALRGQLRAHLTGAPAPTVIALTRPALVEVTLGEVSAAPRRSLAPPALDGAVARMALWRGGEAEGAIALDRARRGERPAPRAFAHVFCRWLRDGTIEPGFDLTDFLSLPDGVKYHRLLSRPLTVGETVAIGVAL